MKKSNPLWISAIMIIFIIIIANAIMSIRISEYRGELGSVEKNSAKDILFEGKVKTNEPCPDAEGGLDSAVLQVKYFYSKFCAWCMKEEPILQRLAKNQGNLVNIKWYNVRSCPELAAQYSVSGVPTFVFSTLNNQTEYSHYGFIYEKDLKNMVCEVSGGC